MVKIAWRTEVSRFTWLKAYGIPQPSLPNYPQRGQVETSYGNRKDTGGLTSEWFWDNMSALQYANLLDIVSSSNANMGLYVEMPHRNNATARFLVMFGRPQYTTLDNTLDLLDNVSLPLSTIIEYKQVAEVSFFSDLTENGQTVTVELLGGDTFVEFPTSDGVGPVMTGSTVSKTYPSGGLFPVKVWTPHGRSLTRFKISRGLRELSDSLLENDLVYLYIPAGAITEIPMSLSTKTTIEKLYMAENALNIAAQLRYDADLSGMIGLTELDISSCNLGTIILPSTFWKHLDLSGNPHLNDAGGWLTDVWLSRNKWAGYLDISDTALPLDGDFLADQTHTDKGKLYSLVNDYGWVVFF